MRAQRKEKQNAVISVYLALMLAVMIPIILTMIEGARISAICLVLESAMDLATDSVLAEYNRPLLEQYDLLFVDTAYEQGRGSIRYLKEHMEDFISYNIYPQKELYPLLFYTDPYGLSLDTLDITEVSRATDENGAVLRYMAVSYMLEKYGIAYVEDMADLVAVTESEGFYDSDILSENDEAQQQVDDYEVEAPEAEYDEEGNLIESDWEEPEKNDPAAQIQSIRNSGILRFVCEGEISAQGIDPAQYVTGRSLVSGDGMCREWTERNTLAEQLLFNEYIMEKCGCYTEPKENSLLRYETEYVLMGQNSDTDNLRAVANRLLLIRGGSNIAYFMEDAELQEEAEAMAAGLSFVTLCPEAEPLYKALIIAAWIMAESLYDVKLLFRGKRVPLIKQQGDWHLSLENAMGLSDATEAGTEEDGEGLKYTDYLRLLLYVTSLENKTGRLMNVIEMDVRRISGYESFRLDDCIAGGTAQFMFKSSYGYTFFAQRRFYYM